MIEFVGFVLVFVLPWLAFENRHLFLLTGMSEPRPADEVDWIHSVRTKYADPIDDFRAGYITKYECAARMAALKRFITPIDFDMVLKSVH